MKILSVCLGILMAGCAGSPSPVESNPSPQKAMPYESDRLDPEVTPAAYQIHLSVDPARPDYTGTVSVELKLTTSKSALWLHSLKHQITSASFKDASGTRHNLTIERKGDDWLGLHAAEPLPAQSGTLNIKFNGTMSNPLFGMYRVQSEKRWYIFSQMEALGAREAFPCFDEPGFNFKNSCSDI